MKHQIFNLKEISQVIGCSTGHVYKLIRQGMPYHQLDENSRRYFIVDEVVEWLKTTGRKQVQVTVWRK